MKNEKYFSIIMPYYKNYDVISRSVMSVLSQTEKDYELIIIDDGSNDEIDKYINNLNDNRIILLKQENFGVAIARNNGVKLAKGKWICFLDSDDEWLPNHLAHIKKMQHIFPKSNFYVTSHQREGNQMVNSSNRIPKSYPQIFELKDFLRFYFTFSGTIHTNSICIRKGLIEKCGYFAENISKGEDTDLWYRCALYSSVVMSKKVTTVYHRDHSFLTKEKEFNYNWVFLSRRYLLDDDQIPEYRKHSLQLIWQKYKLSMCKRYISDGNYNACQNLLKEIKKDLLPELRQSFRKMQLLMMLPKSLIHFIFSLFYRLKSKKY